MLSNKISIITATYNAAYFLPRLIASLRSQTCKDFEWVVADGGSTDGTLEILWQVTDLHLTIDSRPDFGIYDALNRAIKLCSGDYYLVLGADDYLYKDSIYNFFKSISNHSYDIISAKVLCSGQIIAAKNKFKFLYGQGYYTSTHAVGCLIKKKLHHEIGFYSNLYPIGADFLFLKQVGDGGFIIHNADFISGEFGESGISKADMLTSLTDAYRAQIVTGENKVIQTLLLILRIFKNWQKF